MTCECHKIDWMARVKNADKNYTMVDGSPLVPGVDCQDKVNLLKMDMNTYHGVCKYKPEEGSLLPEEVLQDIQGEYQGSKPLNNTPVICQQVLELYQDSNEDPTSQYDTGIDS